MDRCDNPFGTMEELLDRIDTKIKIVDFHAEATAEKKAMAYFLDGRVSAVFGTHTHVMTADAQILEHGTGYITDIGMTGPKNSVLGVDPDISVKWMRTGIPARFDAAGGDCMLNGCIFEIDEKTGTCVSIEPVMTE